MSLFIPNGETWDNHVIMKAILEHWAVLVMSFTLLSQTCRHGIQMLLS